MKLNPNIRKVAVKYGLVGGLMSVLAFAVFYALGHQPWRNLISFILDAVIIGMFCFLAIREFKVSYNGSELRFYHGMTIGFIVYLLIGFVFSLFFAGFINWIVPDFLAEYIQIAIEDLNLRKDMLLEQVDKNPEAFFQDQVEGIRQITRSQLVLDVFLKRVLIGLFVTPIISVALRTNQR
ncbi:DUF4199 domain-containing protein [Roseivirga pacifica]|uniref:DUF4199 domain-containing protein n=1 Tax=Roseivirga pacifica TaxID=1267423 RepID=UPI003BB0A8E8